MHNPPRSILQICRLPSPWGIDPFAQLSMGLKPNQVTTVFLSGKFKSSLSKKYHGKVLFFDINRKKLGWRFKAAQKLWQLCRKNHFDIVICHHYKPTVIMDWVAYFCHIPQCFSVHHTMGNLRRLGRRLYTRVSLRHRWQFISVSNKVKNDLLQSRAGINPQQVKTLYNTIPVLEVVKQQFTRQSARERIGIRKKAFVFGTIGRLVKEKGHFILLEAFAQIHMQLPNACLVILGSGPLENRLNTKAQSLGIADKVFINSKQTQCANRLLCAFDVFVFPSVQEGFGLALLEAMALKLPIIATHCGGIPEVMGETGRLTAPQVTSLAEALQSYFHLSPAERQKIGLKAYSRVCQNFSCSSNQMALEDLLLNL